MADGNTPAATTMHALSKEFRNASDEKILKVTRMIDLLPERGEADALLEPVRARLAALRPARRMNRTRLLFAPFDPVIVSGAAWRPGDLGIPRSVLAPVAALIFGSGDAIPPVPTTLDEGDEAQLTRVGTPLWQAAAACLATAPIPPAWETPDWQKQNGLTVPMVMPLIPVLRLVLDRAAAIRTLPPRQHPDCEQTLTALLSEAMRAGPLGWGIMLRLLFDAAAPDQVTRLALSLARGGLSAPLQAGLDGAIEEMLGRMEAPQPGQAAAEQLDTAALSGVLSGRLHLIDQVEELRRLENRPAEEQRRVARLRQRLAAENRTVFEHALQSRLVALDQVSAEPAPELMPTEAVLAIEADARQLRAFALAAAKLGDADEYDRLLEQAAARYVRNGVKSGMTRADRMRVTELLVGSEKAIQVLGLG